VKLIEDLENQHTEDIKSILQTRSDAFILLKYWEITQEAYRGKF